MKENALSPFSRKRMISSDSSEMTWSSDLSMGTRANKCNTLFEEVMVKMVGSAPDA